MGYTHYWTPKKALTHANIEFVHEIINTTRIPLTGWSGAQGTEIFCSLEDGINFNGVGEDSHENFCYDGLDDDWNFCKTNQKPYDTVVVAVLAHLKDTGVLTWSSDGDSDDHKKGRALYRRIKAKLAKK
jgi:hypothetical protein